jgi:hypothetical protein
MGNCFRTKTHQSPEVIKTPPPPEIQSVADSPKLELPFGTSVLICLDAAPTPESSRLKTFLKGNFGNFASFNGERRLLDQIKSTEGHKYFIVIAGKVEEHTVKVLADSSKVVAIYLCLGQPRAAELPQSTKIRGFYIKHIDLKNAINQDFIDE